MKVFNVRLILSLFIGIGLMLWGFYLLLFSPPPHDMKFILFAAFVSLMGTLILIASKVYLFIRITRSRNAQKED